MSGDERADAGRGGDVGAETAGGRGTDLGASTSHGDARDAQAVGDAKTTRTGENPFAGEDPDRADTGEGGTPEDLRFGKRRTVGLDEDTGAGMPDTSGVPGSTTGGT